MKSLPLVVAAWSSPGSTWWRHRSCCSSSRAATSAGLIDRRERVDDQRTPRSASNRARAAPRRGRPAGRLEVARRQRRPGSGEDLGRRTVEQDPPAPMTTTRANVSATKRMSWLIAMTVRPAADRSAMTRLDPGHAPRVLAGRRFVEHDDRRLHREDRRERRAASGASSRGRTGSRRSSRSGRPPRGRRRTAACGLGRGPPRILRPELRPPPGPCRRRSGDRGSGTTIPTRAASAATRTSATSAPSCEDAALGRAEEPVEVADHRRLARCRSGRRWRPAHRRRSRDRRRPAHACRPGRRSRPPRAQATSRDAPPDRRAAPDRDRARPARGPAGSATAPRRPRSSSRGSARTSRRRTVEHDPAVVDDQDPAAQAVEQVGLVLDDQQRGPARSQLAERLADEPRPLRVELGGRFVEDEVAPVAWPAARR